MGCWGQQPPARQPKLAPQLAVLPPPSRPGPGGKAKVAKMQGGIKRAPFHPQGFKMEAQAAPGHFHSRFDFDTGTPSCRHGRGWGCPVGTEKKEIKEKMKKKNN